MCAVDEGEPLLGGQLDGSESRSRERLRSVHPLPAERRLALADEYEREVRERGQISRRSDRAPAGDHGHDLALEQPEHQLHQLGSRARVTPAQGGGEQQQHAAHHLVLERGTRAHGVGAQEIDLQPGRIACP